jgi:hypothetical protein
MKDNLAITISKTGIERAKAESIWVQFEEYFSAVSACAEKVGGLEIVDVSQKEEMKLARSIRLELKRIRVAAEKRKKELKDGILKEGRFIDATYNLIADATKPVETDLLEKENFAKRKEAERKAAILLQRLDALKPYDVDTQFIDVGEMTDDNFKLFLEKSKSEYEARIEQERKAEEERLAREKAEAEELARVAAENERIRKEQEERERKAAQELAEERARVAAAEEVARREREAREAAEQKIRDEQLRKEREEKERLQRELREKEEAERLERERIEEQRKAEEEEKRRLEQASDKEKLTVYLNQLTDVDVPSVSSTKAKNIIQSLLVYIQNAVAMTEKLTEEE